MNYFPLTILSLQQVNKIRGNTEEITNKAILYSNIVLIACILFVILGGIWLYKNRTKK